MKIEAVEKGSEVLEVKSLDAINGLYSRWPQKKG